VWRFCEAVDWARLAKQAGFNALAAGHAGMELCLSVLPRSPRRSARCRRSRPISTASSAGCDQMAGLAALLERSEVPIRYSEHKIGQGPAFHRYACALGLEGIVSKRLDAGYSPGQRGLWLKTKCLNREEFVIVGWTDPEGSRPFIGALLFGYYDPGGRLVYAGRVGTGMRANQLEDLLRRLQPLQTDRMPLDVAPPRSTRFGSPLVLSRVHRLRPELVLEVKYLTWTDDGLLRQVVYEGIREDKPAREVVRSRPRRRQPRPR
jgi:bifunctional non-homologous end joining protein LigD